MMDTRDSILAGLKRMLRREIRLEIAGTAPEGTASTHFGGRPDLPGDFIWPEYTGEGIDGERKFYYGGKNPEDAILMSRMV